MGQSEGWIQKYEAAILLFLPILLYRGEGWTASLVENVATSEFSPRLKLPPIIWVDWPIGILYSIQLGQLNICKHSLSSSFNSKFPRSTKQSYISITLILPTFYYQEHYFYPFVSNKFYQRDIFFFLLLDEYMKLEKCVQLEEDEIRRRRDIRLAREKELQNKGKWNQSSSNLYLWYQLNIRVF